MVTSWAGERSTPGPLAERLPRVLDDWFAYVEEHPYASSMLFRDTTGDPEVQAFYRDNHAAARAANVASSPSPSECDRQQPVSRSGGASTPKSHGPPSSWSLSTCSHAGSDSPRPIATETEQTCRAGVVHPSKVSLSQESESPPDATRDACSGRASGGRIAHGRTAAFVLGFERHQHLRPYAHSSSNQREIGHDHGCCSHAEAGAVPCYWRRAGPLRFAARHPLCAARHAGGPARFRRGDDRRSASSVSIRTSCRSMLPAVPMPHWAVRTRCPVRR